MTVNYFNSHISHRFPKTILIVLLLFMSTADFFAQRVKEEAPPLSQRMFYGGNLGLQFGTITDIQISPVVGLWVSPRLAVAIGPDYRFFKYRSEQTSIYGAKGYLQFVVIKDISTFLPIGASTGIFLHLEDEVLNLESSYWKNPPVFSSRFNINTVLAGGGISQQVGRRSSIDLMLLWVLNDPGFDVYSNPEFRISFIF